MPNITLGSTITSVLTWLAVMTILTVVLNAKTFAGNGVLPSDVLFKLGGVVNSTNQTYLNQSSGGKVSLNIQTQIQNQTAVTAKAIQPGILSSLGGLAFIPAAFGAFINTVVQIPNTMILIVNTLVNTPNSLTAWLGFSLTALTSCLMAYYVIIFGMKIASPITKTELEDV